MHLDSISYPEALFLNMITFTTIGYGVATEWPLIWSFHILIIIIVVGVVFFNAIEAILESCYGYGHYAAENKSPTFCKKYMPVIIIWIVATVLIAVFWIVFALDLQVSWKQAWFLVVQTMTTVGFGDVTPNTGASLWVSIFLAPCLFVAFIACVASSISLCEKNAFEEKLKQLKTESIWKDIEEDWDMDGDNKLTQAEFVAMFLARMNDMSDEDLEIIKQGYFDLQDIEAPPRT